MKLLVFYLLFSSLFFAIIFHEAAHVLIDYDKNPQRVCIPVLEDNPLGYVSYVEFEAGKSFFSIEFYPFIISFIPVVFVLYLIIRHKLIWRD